MGYKNQNQPIWINLMSFSKRLSALRKKRGLTQHNMAEMAGVHVSQIRRYEAGGSQPSLEALRNLAMALNISADVLLFDEDERAPTDDWQLQFEALSKFTDKEKEVAKAVIESLILRHTAERFAKVG